MAPVHVCARGSPPVLAASAGTAASARPLTRRVVRLEVLHSSSTWMGCSRCSAVRQRNKINKHVVQDKFIRKQIFWLNMGFVIRHAETGRTAVETQIYDSADLLVVTHARQ